MSLFSRWPWVFTAVNSWALRNGVNAQAFRLYNTYTDDTNNEYATLSWATNVLFIGTNFNAPGVTRTVRIITNGASPIEIWTNGISRWSVDGSTGHLLPFVSATYNIGAIATKVGNVFGGGYYTAAAPVTQTGTTYTIGAQDHAVILTNAATVTLTLPAAASFTGRILQLKTTGGGDVISASSNVVPRAGGAAGTAILAVTAGSWAQLQSDGTNWVVMAGS